MIANGEIPAPPKPPPCSCCRREKNEPFTEAPATEMEDDVRGEGRDPEAGHGQEMKVVQVGNNGVAQVWNTPRDPDATEDHFSEASSDDWY